MKRRLQGRAFVKAAGSVVLAGALLLGPVNPAFAGPEDDPSASEMAADLLVARPAGAVVTVLGAAFFVVSLPFSAAGGNLDSAAQTLVVNPARETFVRCLGCRNTGRDIRPKD
ncbi:MAG: hypothetical protein AB8B93_00740 [Pseudomonadales bacterium]